MSNIIISSLHVLLNQTQQNISSYSHLIILVRLGNQVKRTRVWSDDKFSGEWTEEFKFLRTNEDWLEIRLSALQTPQSISGQLLGVTRIPFTDIKDKKNIQEWFNLLHNGQEAGKVHTKIIFQEEDSLNSSNPSNIYSALLAYNKAKKDQKLKQKSLINFNSNDFLTNSLSNLESIHIQNLLSQKIELQLSSLSDQMTTSQTLQYIPDQSCVVPQFKQQLNLLKSSSNLNSQREEYNPSQVFNKSHKSYSQYTTINQNEQIPSKWQNSLIFQDEDQDKKFYQFIQQQLLKEQQINKKLPQQFDNRKQSVQNYTSQYYGQQQYQQIQTKQQNIIDQQYQKQSLSPLLYDQIKDSLYSSQNMDENKYQNLQQQSQHINLQKQQSQPKQQYSRYQAQQNYTQKQEQQEYQQIQTKYQNLINDKQQKSQQSPISYDLIQDPLYTNINMINNIPYQQLSQYNKSSLQLSSKSHEEMFSQTNAFDKQFSINKSITTKQQNNMIQTQPQIQSMVKLSPKNELSVSQQFNSYDPKYSNLQKTQQSKNEYNPQLLLNSVSQILQSDGIYNISQSQIYDQNQQQAKLSNQQLNLVPLKQINQYKNYDSQQQSYKVNSIQSNNIPKMSSDIQNFRNQQLNLVSLQQQNTFQQRSTNIQIQQNPQQNINYQSFHQFNKQSHIQKPQIQYIYS